MKYLKNYFQPFKDIKNFLTCQAMWKQVMGWIWPWVQSFWLLVYIVKDREAWHSAVRGVTNVGHDLATEQHHIEGFPSGAAVNNPPAMQEMQIWSLGQEDPLEKEMATHSSILVWEIP